jgi:hypothetical protein
MLIEVNFKRRSIELNPSINRAYSMRERAWHAVCYAFAQ